MFLAMDGQDENGLQLRKVGPSCIVASIMLKTNYGFPLKIYFDIMIIGAFFNMKMACCN